MYQLLNFLLLTVSLFLFIPIVVLFVECLAAAVTGRQKTTTELLPERPRVAVLVPAHNEAIGISTTLKELLPQLTSHDRLLVVADNCCDETAAVARAFDVAVLERHDLEKRGKGYALDFGLKFLASDPPDVVVVVDADCFVAEGAIAKISHLAATKQRPVQARYLLTPPANASPGAAVSLLAFTVKNLVRPLGLAQLGLPCLLTGTGMAFPWSVIRNASLASSNIVEDMQLSVDLLIAGSPAIFCADAEVTGLLPQQQHAAKSQRTRWEHGHLQTLRTQVPRLLKEWVNQKRFDVLAIALDLCVPPLSLLVMLWLLLTVAAIVTSLTLKLYAPVLVSALEGLLILVSVITAWAKFARDTLPLAALLSVPGYILWKIPLYLRFLVKPQTKWVRTERDVVDSQEL
ncbi:glycosyltransferase family 2 protein [Leptolyngbya sp. FACHB-321]|uniref:glycosyltransferase family 2 protein n=1 Tax=Leptolyngbya sp. FACHB-321 TaxID=2692807 RepID=UPI001687B9AB|nr:glycosyltransferase family 2 protein [Leptolyngbya sp. FACHB-321]MBD2037238.1 glycosyltransferase family 2 protein [Leptolyngbya sp. FACHB-321]